MKAEVLFSSFDTQALLARFGKKIPGVGLMGKTLLKHPKKLGDLGLPLARKLIKDHHLEMELGGIDVQAENAVVKSVSVDVTRINYAQVGVALLPVLQNRLRRTITPQDVTDALEKVELPDNGSLDKVKAAVAAQSDVPNMIRAAADSLSDSEKLALAKAFVSAYQEKLCEKGNSLLTKKGLAAKIAAVRLNG